MIRIAYIDDDSNSEAMKSKFEHMSELDIDVIPIAAISEVIPTLRRLKSSIRCIVLDIIMPPRKVYSLHETNGGTTTGLRLLRDIRTEFKDIPIVIVSVMPESDPETQRAIGSWQIARYLTKPIGGAEIATAVKQAVGLS